MIITEYMENGSLDSFLRVGIKAFPVRCLRSNGPCCIYLILSIQFWVFFIAECLFFVVCSQLSNLLTFPVKL